ncbi:MAG TPA: hypothetical protein VFO29_03125 [Candidatus Rubrimentiphilum sp.]|nr:hypothetical protein [Candidatus Rubrimentiphilum sp.]
MIWRGVRPSLTLYATGAIVATAERIAMGARLAQARRPVCEPCFERMLATNDRSLLCFSCSRLG